MAQHHARGSDNKGKRMLLTSRESVGMYSPVYIYVAAPSSGSNVPKVRVSFSFNSHFICKEHLPEWLLLIQAPICLRWTEVFLDGCQPATW